MGYKKIKRKLLKFFLERHHPNLVILTDEILLNLGFEKQNIIQNLKLFKLDSVLIFKRGNGNFYCDSILIKYVHQVKIFYLFIKCKKLGR